MLKKGKNKLCSKQFLAKDVEEVQKFVLKKLNVPDLFKLRDRFEGNKYLVDTTKKVFLYQTFFQFLGIKRVEKIKFGFLNTFNFEKIMDHNIEYLEYESDVNSMEMIPKTLYVFISVNSKRCTIYTENLNSLEVRNKLELSFLKFGDKIYN